MDADNYGYQRYSYYEHQFDTNGNLVSVERYKADTATLDRLFNIEYEHDDYYNPSNWRRIVKTYTSKGYLINTITKEWNKYGNLLAYSNEDDILNNYSLRYVTDEKNGKTQIYKTTVQNGEFLIEENEFDAKGRLVAQTLYESGLIGRGNWKFQ
jgi:hypothetical protein